MSDDGTVSICEYCQTEIDPNAPDVVLLARMIRVDAQGDAGAEYVEGMPAYFHKRHAPSGPGWRKPTSAQG